MPPEFRERVIDFGHGAYVVLYFVDERQIVLLSIRHSKENGY